jgi:hypothetical protein
MAYAAALALGSELLYVVTGWLDPTSPIHFEALLPAFVLGCVMRHFMPRLESERHAQDTANGTPSLASPSQWHHGH